MSCDLEGTKLALKYDWRVEVKLTSQNCSSLPLILNGSTSSSTVFRERSFKHERIDVMILLELGLPRLKLVFDEIWHHVSHLNVSQF